MVATSLLSLSVLLAGSALAQKLGGGGLAGAASLLGSLPKVRFDKAIEKKAEIRTDAKRTLYRYGPIRLVGKNDPLPPSGFMASMDKHGQSFVFQAGKSVCSNCTVLYGVLGLQFEDGSPANGVYVHHFLSFDIDKASSTIIDRCPGSKSTQQLGGFGIAGGLGGGGAQRIMGAGFVGQGDDNWDSPVYFTTTDGTYNSGYHMGKEDKILINADLVNYNAEARDVYITLDLEYLDGHVGSDTTSELLGVGGCNLLGAPNVSKTGPASTKSPKFEIKADGAIVSARGHMHDGGDRMLISVNDKVVCESLAKYKTGSEDAGGIAEMTRCGHAIPVKKGDYITLESVYDLTRHPVRKDGHGEEAIGRSMGIDFMGMYSLTLTAAPKKS